MSNEIDKHLPAEITDSLSTSQLIDALRSRQAALTPEQQSAFKHFLQSLDTPSQVAEAGISGDYPTFPEVEKDAEVLAQDLREHGIGLVNGIFNRKVIAPVPQRNGWQAALGFLKGKEVDVSVAGLELQLGVVAQLNKVPIFPETLQSRKDRQHWLLSQDPISTSLDLRHLGRVTIASDWQIRGFHMPIKAVDRRPGSFNTFMFIAPGDIIQKIDQQEVKSPYFPDALFRHVYPGKVGPNPDTDITRLPAKELMIIDARDWKRGDIKPPSTISKKLISYPRPLPY